jgi:hypothetical protein
MFGTEGSLKSFLALHWCVCVALGAPWLKHPVDRGRAVYVVGEGLSGLGLRLRAQLVRWPELTDHVLQFLGHAPDLTRTEDADRLLRLLRDGIPPDVVVLDTLNRTISGDENAQEVATAWTRNVERIHALYPDCVVLGLHHANNEGAFRGSSVFRANCHTMMQLQRIPSTAEPMTMLTVIKQRESSVGQRYRLTYRVQEVAGQQGGLSTSLVLGRIEPFEPLMGPVPGPDKPSERLNENRLQALVALDLAQREAAGQLVAWTSWRGRCSLKESTFKDARTWLLRQRLVLEHRNTYQLSDAGEMALAEEGRSRPGGPIKGPPSGPAPTLDDVLEPEAPINGPWSGPAPAQEDEPLPW